MKDFKWLLNQVRLSWISLISKIKNFFKRTNASNKEDEQDIFEDALTEQELDEEKYFDAVEDLGEQENSKRKEYEENKYYSLQDDLQEKNEFDRATHTLTLAFEIEKSLPDFDLSKFKLCELKQNGDKYTFTLEDNQKNRIELHSGYLNIYFPKYFEKYSKKGAYTELFSQEENRIRNDIIIPLQVPKEVGILTKKFSWMNPKNVMQSQIPDFPADVYLKDCKDDVNFYLNSNNTISLSLMSKWIKAGAKLSGTPIETNWPIKDILVRGSFINQLDKRFRIEEVIIDKRPIAEEAFEVVDVECPSKLKVSQPNM